MRLYIFQFSVWFIRSSVYSIYNCRILRLKSTFHQLDTNNTKTTKTRSTEVCCRVHYNEHHLNSSTGWAQPYSISSVCTHLVNLISLRGKPVVLLSKEWLACCSYPKSCYATSLYRWNYMFNVYKVNGKYALLPNQYDHAIVIIMKDGKVIESY